jgi:hypothetical protein
MSLVPYKLDPEQERRILEELLGGNSQAPPQPGVVASGAYKDVVFERLAYREPGKSDKTLSAFDKSLERLRKAGYQRHARPREAFGLVIDGLEGRLTGAAKQVGEDMLVSYGEWLSLAVRPVQGVLHCYFDPENLVGNGAVYAVQGSVLKHAGEQVFPIKGLPLQSWVPLKDVALVSPVLVETLWSRPYAKLPGEIQKNAKLYLPQEGVAWPVGRGYFYGFDVVGCSFNSRASRGVVVGAKNSIGSEGS